MTYPAVPGGRGGGGVVASLGIVLAVVLGAIALLLVFAIAAAVIGRETHRLDAEAPRPVFDVDEAVDWVAAALPFEVAARLTHGDVHQLLGFSLDHLATPLVPGARQPADEGLSLVAGEEALRRVHDQALAAGLECTGPQVRAVLEAELGYLRVIGAVGPPEPPDGSS